MRTTILTLAAAMAVTPLAATPAAATEASAVLAVVKQFDDGFNKGDAAGSIKTCTTRAVIIDDFAPFVWQGPTACADWWKAISAEDAKNGVTDGIVTLGPKPWRATVTGARAYVVEPVTYTYKQHGKPVIESGSVWTLTLVKTGGAWRIAGWAWAQH